MPQIYFSALFVFHILSCLTQTKSVNESNIDFVMQICLENNIGDQECLLIMFKIQQYSHSKISLTTYTKRKYIFYLALGKSMLLIIPKTLTYNKLLKSGQNTSWLCLLASTILAQHIFAHSAGALC